MIIQKSYFIFLLALATTLSSCSTIKISGLPKDSGKIERIPFTISKANNIIFDAVLNGEDTLKLFFDTGGTSLVLRQAIIKTNTSLLNDKNSSSVNEDYIPVIEENSLSIAGISWEGVTMFPTRIGPTEADGHFGWNLFEDKVVELDYENQVMSVSNNLVQSVEGYAKLKIEYTHTLFCIKASIGIKGVEYTARYLFDTGFQRAVILDKDLRKKNNFPENLPIIKESRLKNGAGIEFVNYVVKTDEVKFGNVVATNVPVQLLSTPNPARFMTHILGGELLKRFNTILDFKNNFVYLKPNSLIGLPYSDAS